MEAASAEQLLVRFLFLYNEDEQTEACSTALVRVTTSQAAHENSYCGLSLAHLLFNVCTKQTYTQTFAVPLTNKKDNLYVVTQYRTVILLYY